MSKFDVYLAKNASLSEALSGGFQIFTQVAPEGAALNGQSRLFSIDLVESPESVSIDSKSMLDLLKAYPVGSLSYDYAELKKSAPDSNQSEYYVNHPGFQAELRAITMNSRVFNSIFKSAGGFVDEARESNDVVSLQNLGQLYMGHVDRIKAYTEFCENNGIGTHLAMTVGPMTKAYESYRDEVHAFNVDQYKAALRLELGSNSPKVIKDYGFQSATRPHSWGGTEEHIKAIEDATPAGPLTVELGVDFSEIEANYNHLLDRAHGASKSSSLFPYDKALSSMSDEDRAEMVVSLYNALTPDAKAGFASYIREQGTDEVKAHLLQDILDSHISYDQHAESIAKSIETPQALNFDGALKSAFEGLNDETLSVSAEFNLNKLNSILSAPNATGGLNKADMALLNKSVGLFNNGKDQLPLSSKLKVEKLANSYNKLLARPEHIDHILDPYLEYPVVRLGAETQQLEINYTPANSLFYGALENIHIPQSIASANYPYKSVAESHLVSNPLADYIVPDLVQSVRQEIAGINNGSIPSYMAEHIVPAHAYLKSAHASEEEIIGAVSSPIGFVDDDMPNLAALDLLQNGKTELQPAKDAIITTLLNVDIQNNRQISESSILTSMESVKYVDKVTPELVGSLATITASHFADRQPELVEKIQSVTDAYKQSLGNGAANELLKASVTKGQASPFNGRVAIHDVETRDTQSTHMR